MAEGEVYDLNDQVKIELAGKNRAGLSLCVSDL